MKQSCNMLMGVQRSQIKCQGGLDKRREKARSVGGHDVIQPHGSEISEMCRDNRVCTVIFTMGCAF